MRTPHDDYEHPMTISVVVHNPIELRAVYSALAAGGFGSPASEPIPGPWPNANQTSSGDYTPAPISGVTENPDKAPAEEVKVRKTRVTKEKPIEPTPAPADEQPETEEDEFAAFRDADGAGKPIEPITDADLSSACNDAAAAMGSPNAVKALIAQFVPEGEVVHSRNVPLDKRPDFVEQIKALHK